MWAMEKATATEKIFWAIKKSNGNANRVAFKSLATNTYNFYEISTF